MVGSKIGLTSNPLSNSNHRLIPKSGKLPKSDNPYDPIEQYFDQEGWNHLVELCAKEWTGDEFQSELLKQLNGELDIAQVLFVTHRSSSLNYLTHKVPALGNLTPLECMESESLKKRLKECLRRTP